MSEWQTTAKALVQLPDFIVQARVFAGMTRHNPDHAAPLLAYMREQDGPNRALWRQFDVNQVQSIGRNYSQGMGGPVQ